MRGLWLLHAGPPPDREAVRRAIERIGRRPEFDQRPGLLERFLRWLDRLLSRQKGPQTSFNGGVPNIFGYLLVVVMAVVLVAAIAIGVRYWLRRDRKESDDVDVELIEDESRTASEWASEAERLERDGRLRDALVARYREMVMRLIEAGAVSRSPGRTCGELMLDVAETAPDRLDRFALATGDFEDVWYGGEVVDVERLNRHRAACEQVLEGLKHVAGAAPAPVRGAPDEVESA